MIGNDICGAGHPGSKGNVSDAPVPCGAVARPVTRAAAVRAGRGLCALVCHVSSRRARRRQHVHRRGARLGLLAGLPRLLQGRERPHLAAARHPAVGGPRRAPRAHGGGGAALDQRQDGDQPRRAAQPHPPGRQEGRAALRGQRVPAPRLHLELRRAAADVGEPAARGREHAGARRQRPHRRDRDRAARGGARRRAARQAAGRAGAHRRGRDGLEAAGRGRARPRRRRAARPGRRGGALPGPASRHRRVVPPLQGARRQAAQRLRLRRRGEGRRLRAPRRGRGARLLAGAGGRPGGRRRGHLQDERVGGGQPGARGARGGGARAGRRAARRAAAGAAAARGQVALRVEPVARRGAGAGRRGGDLKRHVPGTPGGFCAGGLTSSE